MGKSKSGRSRTEKLFWNNPHRLQSLLFLVVDLRLQQNFNEFSYFAEVFQLNFIRPKENYKK